MPKLFYVMLSAVFVSLLATACRCNYDDADPQVANRPVKLVLKDSVTGENLVGAARRYHPDSIFFTGVFFYGNQGDPALIDTAGTDTAVVVAHPGTLDGADCKGNPYPRRVGNIDSVFLHLSPSDTDTLVVDATGSGDIILFYNGRPLLTTPYADNALRTIEVRK